MVHLHDLVHAVVTSQLTRPHPDGAQFKPVPVLVRVRTADGVWFEVPVRSFTIVPGPRQPEGGEKNRLLGPAAVVLGCDVPSLAPPLGAGPVAEERRVDFPVISSAAFVGKLQPLPIPDLDDESPTFDGTYPVDRDVLRMKSPPVPGSDSNG